MIIDCISDLHGYHPKLDGGDLLIIAGDMTRNDKIPQWHRFYKWLATLDYKKIICIAGNHDGYLKDCMPTQKANELFKDLLEMKDNPKYEYLCDNGFTYSDYEQIRALIGENNGQLVYRKDYKIWGSPWTRKFFDWHFMKSNDELEEHWKQIPDDVEILITHGPAFGIRDCTVDKRRVGDKALWRRIKELKNLKLHIFGHIHEAYGEDNNHGYKAVNCSHVDYHYNPKNNPIRVIL